MNQQPSSTTHTEKVAEYLGRLAWIEKPSKISYWRKSGRNWLYQVDVEGKPAYVLKLYRGGGWHNHQREVLALHKLQELGFGYAPQIVYANSGIPAFDGRSLLIYRYIEGETLTPDRFKTGYVDQMAHLLGKLYQYGVSGEVLGLGKPQTISGYWQETGQALKSAQVAAAFQGQISELSRLATAHVANFNLTGNSKLSLFHGDLALNNFLVSPNGSLHLVDWEQFGAGDAAIDGAWGLFLNRFELDHEQKERLLEQLPELKGRILHFYPLLQLRYLLSILQGIEKWRVKPSHQPAFEPQSAEARHYWLMESLAKLKSDFEDFKGERGIFFLEKTLTPMPVMSEQATPKSPAFILRNTVSGLYLTFLNGLNDGMVRLLPVPPRFNSLEFTIGRQEGCDICLSYDNLLSRRHARITVELGDNDEWHCWLEDLNSQNGTYLEREKLGTGYWSLKLGQMFRVGFSLLQLDSQPQSQADNFTLTEFANSAIINSTDELTRQYLQVAQTMARQMAVSWLGVEHLFLALTLEEKELAVSLLKKYHFRIADFQTELKLWAGSQNQPGTNQSQLPLTPRLHRVIERADQLAAIARENSRRKPFNPHPHRYLLTAILEDDNSLPSRLFAAEGVDKTKIMRYLK
jgi:thiamine kinase-like enzyme